MWSLLKTKARESERVAEIATTPVDPFEGDELGARAQVKDALRQISGSPHFERSWVVLKRAWDQLQPDSHNQWRKAFEYIQSEYVVWLATLRLEAAKSRHPLVAFVGELVDACL